MVAPDLKQHILEVMGDSPYDAASDGTIKEMLRRKDRKVSQQQIQKAAAELIKEGYLEVVGEKGARQRYSLLEDSPSHLD